LAYGEKEGEVFLGRDYGHVKNYSEATANAIDEEIRQIVEENYKSTQEILSKNKDALIEVSEALLERENMDGSEIRAILFGAEEVVATEANDAAEDDSATIEATDDVDDSATAEVPAAEE